MPFEEMTMESRAASLDGCTDPDNCRRCSAPAHARDGLHHAGIPLRSSDTPANVRYKQVAGSGNCMQCAMAFMLGLRIDQVPDFAASGSPQQCWELFESFAESQGYSAVMIPGNRSFEADYLVSGTSPRGTPHMVVMNDGRLVHDPHPSNAGLSDVQCVWLLARRSLAAENAEAKVARPNFGGRPYPEIGELVQDLNNCINEYVGQIPLAAAIGALHIVEHGLLQPEESP